ncbi:MAG: hypothetical protein ABI604_11600 [Nitrospirota bacterium]
MDALLRPGADKCGRKGCQAQGVYPVTVLENLVRKTFNPYGHTDVYDSADYVTALRKQGRKQSDDAFLADIEAWRKSRSS